MYCLSFTDQALDDLAAIAAYIGDSSGSVGIGERFVGELISKCEALAALGGQLGRARPELRPDMRSIDHKNYVIFFRYRADGMEVVDVLEGHRDLDAFFAAGS
ncbi:type II toxin-antitoxin system RelE/ParE family toxin [Salmonella enterica subsp. enterica serovar Virchow]|nr:type II toxin-antitoxin system RelE/ParE family toxin [Salmonella enterica subsp. enterica serovar Virchow]EFG8199761.1 type II toxin-antitoxin system RelE/ParE family toxin [Escherichia coli]